MTPLDLGIATALLFGTGGVAIHHQLRKARESRIRAEADAFGGRLDEN